jgi:hypothetical protein
MLSLKKKTTVAALSAGLALTLAACGSDEGATGANGSTGSDTGSTSTSASAEPVAAIDSLSGKQTAVTLDPAFLEGLTALQLTPATIGGATLEGAKIAFPITGGNVTYFDPSSGVEPYVQGLIEHDGSGLQLTGANGKVVELTDFVVDPAESVLTGKVTVDGEVFAEGADLFFLDGRTLKPLAEGSEPNTAVLEGTTVSLTKTAADALNMVFETDALAEFFPVGVAEITVDVPQS